MLKRIATLILRNNPREDPPPPPPGSPERAFAAGLAVLLFVLWTLPTPGPLAQARNPASSHVVIGRPATLISRSPALMPARSAGADPAAGPVRPRGTRADPRCRPAPSASDTR